METETETQATVASPPKFTRYRSVRNAAAPKATSAPPPVPQHAENGVKRSMSRYKGDRPVRSATVGTGDQAAAPLNTSIDKNMRDFASRQPVKANGSGVPSKPWSQEELYESVQPAPNPQCPDMTDMSLDVRDPARDVSPLPSRVRKTYAPYSTTENGTSAEPESSFDRAQQEAYAILNGGLYQQEKPREERHVVREAVKRKGANEAASHGAGGRHVEKSSEALLRYERDKERRQTTEHTGGRTQRTTTTSPRQKSGKESHGLNYQSSSNRNTSSGSGPPRKSSNPHEPSMKHVPGQHAEVPSNAAGIDAPISAVNAGDRRVLVKCNEQSIYLPVTPTTTPIDIVISAANVLSEKIDTKSSMVLESFKTLGLERPLRRYEHIRDVLNSWDQDDQNYLSIVPSPTGTNDDELDVKKVPTTQPGDTTVHLYHSQKPGSWDKRWITLRADGQMLLSKQKGGDAKNICHMSDFDIYIPTPRQMKRLKPPRKLCFAVKSQQKSAMFLNTTNFVHFFSTKDKALAAAWYKAVQEWRSWYLVNAMGLGQVPKSEPSSSQHHGARDNRLASQQRHSSAASSNHQHIGSFKPLVAENMFERNSALDSRNRTSLPTQTFTASQKLLRNHISPPISFPTKKLTKDATTGAATTRAHGPSLIQNPPAAAPPDPFSSTGLLGRTYSTRQRAHQTTTASTANPIDIPSHPSSSPPTKSSPHKSSPHHHHHQTVKPLIDLQPQYQPPPQHARKGRGLIPSQLPPGGLVDIATSPEVAIPIPPATSWRKLQSSPETGNGNGAGHGNAGQRTMTLRGGERTSPPQDAFTGGLLAKAGEGVGGRGVGRGLKHGVRDAKEPLIVVEAERGFVKGSLLDGVVGKG